MSALTRRKFLGGSLGAGGALLLSSCVTGGDDEETGGGGDEGGGGGGGGGPITLQATLSDPDPKAATELIVEGYEDGEVDLNWVATETFRAQLPTYLNSGDPPDVLTWYAGSVANDYASKGFLLDLTELWDGPLSGYSDALKSLSTADDGQQIFIPTSYYWWSIFYRKSMFKEWGVEPVETWQDFMDLCKTLDGQGVAPMTMGTGSTAWMASGWFDYLNVRVNGPDYHRELLAGEHSFDDPEVHEVMDYYAQIIPYIDPKGRAQSWQDAATPFVRGDAAMYLMGAFFTSVLPDEVVDDLDFFRVPIIDESVPLTEEAPTDGYFAAAKSDNPEGAKAYLGYVSQPEVQQQWIERAKSSNLPTAPDADESQFSPLVQKGLDYLNETEELTQFFNRDSSDELQTTADTALTKFLDSPGDVDKILADWQTAADQVFNA